MIDGLGVAGWGVGGIEAEAAMLGQVPMLSCFGKIPVIRFPQMICIPAGKSFDKITVGISQLVVCGFFSIEKGI